MKWWADLLVFVVKKFWPWFLKFVWPVVKAHVMDFVSFLLHTVFERVKQIFSEKTASRGEEAKQKAEAAEAKADSVTDNAEAEKYRAIAQVWREVAEQFRRDNEDLKRQLETAEEFHQKCAADEINEMDIKVDFDKEKPVLTIGEAKTVLPALPQ